MEYLCIIRKWLIISKRKYQLQESKPNTKRYERLAGFDSRSWYFRLVKMNLNINTETPYFFIIILLYFARKNIPTMFNKYGLPIYSWFLFKIKILEKDMNLMCTIFANLYMLLTCGPIRFAMGTPYIFYIYMIKIMWLVGPFSYCTEKN